MQADDTSGPRRRTALRAQLEAPAPMAAPPELRFHATAEIPGSDRDILMGYQIFLGRDPESSFVISDAKASPLRAFVRGLLAAGEFQSAVVTPLGRGLRLPHDRVGPRPAAEHTAWIAGVLVLDADTRLALADAPDWNAFWRTLAAVPGMPLTPRATAAPAAGEVTAVDADDGFVLITIDQPKPGEKLHPGALVSGVGWAIAPADIVEVAVYLDDTLLAHARYGLPRPDVARNFPHYRHVDHCGFAFSATVPGDIELTAASQLCIAVRTVAGHTGRRAVRVEPPVKAPAQTWPIRVLVEDVRVDAEGQLMVRGWAVARDGVARIALLLGDAPLGDAELGLARPDIAGAHPDYADAERSGFLFGGTLRGHAPGAASLRLQVIDRNGQQRQAIVPVTVPPGAAVPAPAPVATEPAAAEPVTAEPVTAPAGPESAPSATRAEQPTATPAKDAVPAEAPLPDGLRFYCDKAWLLPDGGIDVGGWVLADEGVLDVAVTLDGRMLGQAQLGGRRPDVARRFPENKAAATSGFSFYAPAAAGPFDKATRITLAVRARNGPGAQTGAQTGAQRGAQRGARMDVPLEPAPGPEPVAAQVQVASLRLEIDHPAVADGRALAPVRGALTIAGWAVAREGIAGVRALCDDTPLGDAYLGQRREDIARAFPECEDALRAGFALVLPPGAVPEGSHRIRLIATSRVGASTERTFSVSIEAPDAEAPGAAPRLRMPRAEQRFVEAVFFARACRPEFQVVVQVGAADGEAALARTLESLGRQVHTAFHVVIVAPNAATRRGLAKLCAAPALADRIALVATAPKTLPAAAAAAPVLFMALLAGDELGCDALLELAAAYAADPRRGFIYGDDRRPHTAHRRPEPFHKPDFSPELLLNMDYVGRPWCADAATMRAACVGLQDLATLAPYDAALRLTEATSRVYHVPCVLAALPALTEAATAFGALRAAATRRGVIATAEAGAVPGTWRFRRAVERPGVVSIIMPTAGRGELVRRAIASIRATTARGAVEIIVLDNIPRVEKSLKAWLKRNADRVIDMPGAFNWSRFNNVAAAAATGAYLLFLNDDVEASAPGWLEALLEHAQRPEVGVVGARLLYPDGKVQHAGQYLADSHARHAFRFAARDDAGPFGLGKVAREMSAVTGACQMVRADLFDRLGRFDEAHDVINNDLDFCLRVQRAGLAVIYTPHAELMHHELATRAAIEDRFDAARFAGDWRLTLLRGDPFHSPRLMAEADHWAPEPEPVVAVHAGPVGPAHADIRRIVAVKLDHIGDFLTALPALRDIKWRFPAARLTLLAPPATAVLARREAAVDEVIEFTFFHPRSAEGQRSVTDDEFAALAARLGAERFDLAMDLRMQPETRPVLRHAGAALTVGYDHDGRFPWLDVALEWEGDQRLEQKRAHVSERLLMLVAAAEGACRELDPVQVAPTADPMQVPALARLGRAFLARPLVCVHPGVGNQVRQWPAASYAALIDLLIADAGVNVVLVGGGDEQEVAQAVLARVAVKDRVTSLVGSVKLGELTAVMQACALFVGNNSGPKHIAAAAGVPTVGIHSAVVDATEWAPLGGAAMALQRRVICAPCYLEFASDCPRAMACLTGIRPRDVLAACRQALALRPASAARKKGQRALPPAPPLRTSP